MNLQQAYLFYSDKLKEINVDNPSVQARIILKYVLNISDSSFIINPDMQLTETQLKNLQTIFSKIIKGVPLAYVLNSQFFWKHDFYVNENVLIPRQDSETLIEEFLKHFKSDIQSLNILEIGVGSGCLILSILSEYQQFQATGVDISTKAIEVCKINAKNLQVDNRLKLVQSDLFKNVENKFDVIISNPPYIDENDKDLAEDVKKFEPSTALFAKNKGLYFYEEILKNAKKYLNKNGLIFFEIGYTQNLEVINLAKKNGFKHLKTAKDLGKNNRVVVLQVEQ